jgi:hypothetical protein
MENASALFQKTSARKIIVQPIRTKYVWSADANKQVAGVGNLPTYRGEHQKKTGIPTPLTLR